MAKDFDFSRQAAFRHPALADPWDSALDAGPGAVMAVLTDTHGPAYRNPGTAMMIAADGRVAGALTSGCIEADLIRHADAVRRDGATRRLRYGEGSPFLDLRLPCGGAIEVTLFRVEDFDVLARLARLRAGRGDATLRLSSSGRLDLVPLGTATRHDDVLILFRPPVRFVVFGAGAEATVFVELVQSLGYDHVLVSHEPQSIGTARQLGCNVRQMTALTDPADFLLDDRSAALLFYHDHDYEPEIIHRLLAGRAFYIGAQGSRATHSRRLDRLRQMGASPQSLERVRGPIGLIRSTRDPRQLAISVLAEVTMLAGQDIMAPQPA